MTDNINEISNSSSTELTVLRSDYKHLNHKQWKALLKKLKRKEIRTLAAKSRDEEKGDKSDAQSETNSEEEREWEEEEKNRQYQHQLWLERERQAELAFKAKKEWEEKEKKRKEEIERKIKEEWEERERQENEEREKKEKEDQEKRLKQDKLLKEATSNENTNAWHNPIAPVQYGKERQVDVCPFFKKTAACRFGDHCSRYHEYPECSTTILIPNMFSSFQLEQSIVDNVDTDVSLEYDENELYQSFKEFYEDTVPEFKTVGTIVQLKVCCNCEPHLRGNVYVQYKRQSSAQEAYGKFNARWYGGRQLTCIFVNIESWKAAICGLASKKRCPKGKSCNFLHVFRNPGGEFSEMDYDQNLQDRYENQRENKHYSRREYRSRSRRSRSTSRSRRSRSTSRSKSSRSRRRSTSKARSLKSRHRSRSPSSNHSRNYNKTSRSSKSHKRSRSRSPSRTSNSNKPSPSKSPRRSHRSKRSRSKSHASIRNTSSKQRKSRSKSPKDVKYITNHYAKTKGRSLSDSSSSSDSPPSPKSLKQKSNKNFHSSTKDTSTESESDYEYVEKTKETIT
ncbi:U2 small nuclear ribonucleoprotein auxiliary factor 35 kDa subunit-related protein 2-like isoform X1 [Physella acuta]|uniref:U2 small nuclear ribonucleoprotein auxiliary factor 35 kDa subunit-related protein 2-like isoform X1 n=1 Tax=Physella acuta TaxID=109671 RepID=UPI0027DDE193|nr:U2 small nuclear ribonucleoprotein auxiliary factor 35 kDa subunit-related protein 2-like isoform X1 [Physella acuta]